MQDGVCVSEGHRETGVDGCIWDMADAVCVGGAEDHGRGSPFAWEARREEARRRGMLWQFFVLWV